MAIPILRPGAGGSLNPTTGTGLTPVAQASGGFLSDLNQFFGGPIASTNTSGQTQTGQSNQSSTQNTGTTSGQTQGTTKTSTTPNLPAWYSSFLAQIPNQMQGLASMYQNNLNKPLYGAPQQANFQNQLAHSQGAAQQSLTSQLAAAGALNSGRAAQMDTQLALGGQSQLGNYLAQVPLQNAQYQNTQLQGLQGLTGQMAGFTSPIQAFGTTQQGNTTGTTAGATTGNTDTTGSNLSNSVSSGQGSGQTSPNVLGGLSASALSALIPYLLKQFGSGGGGQPVYNSGGPLDPSTYPIGGIGGYGGWGGGGFGYPDGNAFGGYDPFSSAFGG